MKDRLREHADGLLYTSERRGKGIRSFRMLLARKIAALEDTESFPLEARQAAARELREKT